VAAGLGAASPAPAPGSGPCGGGAPWPIVVEEAGLMAFSVDAPPGVTVGLAAGGACLTPTLGRRTALWLEPGAYALVAQGAGGAPVVGLGFTRPAALAAEGVPPRVAERALRAADAAFTDGEARRLSLAVLDMERPSTDERLWLFDLGTGELLLQAHVSHGVGSGDPRDPARARSFSTTPDSKQTSLGLYAAAETYVGKHGRSLRLDGLEGGVNDLARPRDIVVHGADYARPAHVADAGYLGRSWGCPAVDDRLAQGLIDALTGGGLLWIWHPALEALSTHGAGAAARPR